MEKIFNDKEFSNILAQINNLYENMTEFAKSANFDRSYISKYIHLKLPNPPSPKILERIANASKGVTNYEELMRICGYFGAPHSAIYDFSSDNDKKSIDLIINYSILNNLSSTDIIADEYCKQILNTLESINIQQALKVIKLEVDKHLLIYGPVNQEKAVLIKVPILGKIAAGQPILADEYLEGYLPLDPGIYNLTSDEDVFYLKVSGESMNLKVKNGDYVLVKKQDFAEDGDLIVAIVNGDDEATFKRYKKLNDQFILLEPMSSDTTIQSITVDLKNQNFKIIGKAIGQFGKF